MFRERYVGSDAGSRILSHTWISGDGRNQSSGIGRPLGWQFGCTGPQIRPCGGTCHTNWWLIIIDHHNIIIYYIIISCCEWKLQNTWGMPYFQSRSGPPPLPPWSVSSTPPRSVSSFQPYPDWSYGADNATWICRSLRDAKKRKDPQKTRSSHPFQLQDDQRKLGSNLPSYGWLLPVTIHSMKGGVRLLRETFYIT